MIKVRILRPTTINQEPGKGDPPTYAPGDVVELKGPNERALAQELVGMAKAEYVSGDPVNEPAPSDRDIPAVTTASLEPPETTAKPKAKARTAS